MYPAINCLKHFIKCDFILEDSTNLYDFVGGICYNSTTISYDFIGIYLVKMKRTGTKTQVYRGTRLRTPGNLKKSDLMKNKFGKIVSKKASSLAKRKSNLGRYLSTKSKPKPKPKAKTTRRRRKPVKVQKTKLTSFFKKK